MDSVGLCARGRFSERLRRVPLPLVVAMALVLLPLGVLAVRAVLGSWSTVSDYSVIELRVRDVGTRHTPTTGVYSRFDWLHPGPLLFYTYAGPYRVLGSEATGLLLGNVLVNTASVATVLVVAWQRGRATGVALAGLASAIFLHALGAGFLEDPWNPWVVVVPMFTTAVVAWHVAAGAHRWLPVVVAFGSFAMQAHVGTALAAVTMVTFAMAALAVDAWRHRVERLGRIIMTTAALGFLLWLAPLIDQVSGRGNLGDLVRFWTTNDAPTTGFAEGARIVAPHLGIWAPWASGDIQVSNFTAEVDPRAVPPLALFLLMVAMVIAWRRRDRESLALGGCALALTGASFMAASRIVDLPLEYVVRWIWVVGVVVWLAIAWTLVKAVRAASRLVTIGVMIIAVAIAGALTGAATLDALETDHPQAEHVALLDAMRDPVIEQLEDARGPILIGHTPGYCSAGMAVGVVNELVRSGIDGRLPPSSDAAVGRHHVVAAENAPTRGIAVCDEEVDEYAADPAYEEIVVVEIDGGERRAGLFRDRSTGDARAADSLP